MPEVPVEQPGFGMVANAAQKYLPTVVRSAILQLKLGRSNPQLKESNLVNDKQTKSHCNRGTNLFNCNPAARERHKLWLWQSNYNAMNKPSKNTWSQGTRQGSYLVKKQYHFRAKPKLSTVNEITMQDNAHTWFMAITLHSKATP